MTIPSAPYRRILIAAALSGLLSARVAGVEPPTPSRPKGGGGTPGPCFCQADFHASSGGVSNLNGVFEPGETVLVEPAWATGLLDPASFASSASAFAGPPGATYTIVDAAGSYSIPANAIALCNDCFVMSIDDPVTRPAAHWDATFSESTVWGGASWTLHVGRSFADVPADSLFNLFIETLFHVNVTTGCGTGYCPSSAVTRAQMAVFLLKGKFGSSYVPPAATGTIFTDVPAGSFAADWIEDLFNQGIAAGCQAAPAMFCPSAPVTRAQMAVFLLKMEHGSAYAPPACAGVFADVECAPTPAFAVDWIEQLSTEGITGGCGGGNYCPDSPNTRGQMAVFIVKTFGLELIDRDPS